ncbi:MAG: hypothetical protein DRI61_17370 [Chloroflexi bacterium]|nr:MAG: hypothetical protein DRI61_17370 [Chloroflexota bacterium]
MKRIPASEKMRKELEALLKGVDSKEFLLSEIFRKGTAIILQELLEQEVTEFLGRRHYERQKGDKKELLTINIGEEILAIVMVMSHLISRQLRVKYVFISLR